MRIKPVITAAVAAGALVLWLLLAATPALAASWRQVSGERDSVLTDVQQGLDGTRHAVFLQRRASGGGSAYDVVDRQLGSGGTLAGTQPVTSGWSSVLAARLIPTAKGLIALVSGRPTPQDAAVVRAFRAPLGGGAWSPIEAGDADMAAGDTFFGEVAQHFTGAAAAKIVTGPPLAALPDQTLLLTRPRYNDDVEIRRLLSDRRREGHITLPDSLGKNCQIGRSAPAADAAGTAYVLYSIGSATDVTEGRCADALLRQQIDPSTLGPIGPPTPLPVPAALGGPAILRVNPGSLFGSPTILDIVPGPDGRPWAVHTLRVADAEARRRKLRPTHRHYGSYSHDELALWDPAGRLLRVPRYRPPGERTPDRLSATDTAKPVVRIFPNGDIVVAHVTNSNRLMKRACPQYRKLEAQLRKLKAHLRKRGKAAAAARAKRCLYGLLPPAIVVGRRHAGRWSFQEIPGPRYRRKREFFVALRVLADSSSSFDVAVESDYVTGSGIPTDLNRLFASKGGVFVTRVKF